jgi:threonine/homoserine/homoserine lactone efflux protein
VVTVTGDWLPALGTLLPLAVVVAISPFSIVPAVLLVLHTARPKSTGLAFAAGWLAGLAAIAVVFVEVPHLFDGLDRPMPGWANWARIVFGVALLVIGVWRWMTRAKAAPASKLLTSIRKVSPGGAGVLGLGLTVMNPKVLLVSAAAGLAIGTADLSAVATWSSVACYAAVAGSSVILPVMGYVIAAERADARLERAKNWIERHQAALTAVVLFLVGSLLLFTGLRAR